MNITHGMNVDEVRVLGAQLQRKADRLDEMVAAIDGAVSSTSWSGRDAEDFRGPWWEHHRGALISAAADLRGFGQSALNNADEQEAVSGGGAPLGDGRVLAEHRLPSGASASMSDYVSEIAHLRPGEIVVRKVSDDPERWVVLLRGLELSSDGVNDLPSTLDAFYGAGSDYTDRVWDLLAEKGVGPDAEIGVIGHSQGGIAAIDLANADSRFTHVLTLGSPIDHKRMPSGASVLSIENTHDAIPRLDEPWAHAGPGALASGIALGPAGGLIGGAGAASAIYTAGSNLFSGADAPKVHFGSSGEAGAHGIEGNYLDAVRSFEEEGVSGVTVDESHRDTGASFLDDFRNTYGGGAGSSKAETGTLPG